jgi:hypothetical protein
LKTPENVFSVSRIQWQNFPVSLFARLPPRSLAIQPSFRILRAISQALPLEFRSGTLNSLEGKEVEVCTLR